MKLGSRALSEAIMGASDGAFTGLGLVLGLVVGLSAVGLWHVALTTTVAGTASMSLGEYQKDNDNGWEECVAMAVSWAVLCLLPVLTALVGLGWELVPIELLGLGIAITGARERKLKARGFAKTYLLMLGVAVPTLVTALVV